MTRIKWFKNGLRDGFPIFLGYLAVSFTFGIAARGTGLTTWQSVLISATNFTSAGQFAALDLIYLSASYLEMGFTQLIINLRYCLMSSALSQKLDPHMPFAHRFGIAFGNTDEVFGVSVTQKQSLSPFYSYGLITISLVGWSLGTLLGCISGDLLPARVLSALSVALYGMFIAIIIPPAKKSKIIAGVVLISMLCSYLFSILPVLRNISSGFRIILLTLVIAGTAAALFPVHEQEGKADAA